MTKTVFVFEKDKANQVNRYIGKTFIESLQRPTEYIGCNVKKSNN